ncbi:hypothetical protein BJ912DRAFT_978296 [Pholiota molesta]|nr:hypothetical protein BJ912DRAFT_978296 [Pholiota molesta]
MAEGLLALPQELWIQILSNLDATSLTHCAMTCKSMYETLQGSSHLEYIVQLYLNGFEDAKTSTPHSELIQHLLHYRKVWLSLPPTKGLEYISLDMKHPYQRKELVGGAFADAVKQHFEIVQLPTAYSNGEKPTTRTASTGTPIRDFAMDPTQDLMVFLEDDTTPSSPTATHTVCVHIRTISTNATHPLARQSPLQLTVPPNPYGNDVYNVLLQLARNTLVLSFYPPSQIQPRVHIWDWTTSDILVDSSISFDPLIPPSRYGIGLLDSTRCFVTSRVGAGAIRLYNFLQSPLTTSAPIHLATLHLPPTSPGTVIDMMSAHAGPIEANPQPHMPFMINDEDRLHVFEVIYKVDPTLHKASLNVFVHQHVLTMYYMRGMQRRDADPAAPPLDIPWSEWGPQNTHVRSPAITESRWKRFVHGQRVIYPAPNKYDDRYSGVVNILDFSRAAVQTSIRACGSARGTDI